MSRSPEACGDVGDPDDDEDDDEGFLDDDDVNEKDVRDQKWVDLGRGDTTCVDEEEGGEENGDIVLLLFLV